MKILFLLLTILFSLSTFLGAGYVITTAGEANAGFACVPMALTLASLTTYRVLCSKEKQENN